MADTSKEPWLPGSFSKNFSWGLLPGLKALHQSIRVGFAGELTDVPREVYRNRIQNEGRPDLIPVNFFLFNRTVLGRDYLVVDELVFQALTEQHSDGFDRLAVFALNLSIVGRYSGTKPGQRYPAPWANQYIINKLADQYNWDSSKVTAQDIELYLRNESRFQSKTSYTKVSTNLARFYTIGGLSDFGSKRITRWWVDALFLAIDRLVLDREIDGQSTSASAIPSLLLKSNFQKLTGPQTAEKSFAMAHILSLYNICGGRARFDPVEVQDRIRVLIPEYHFQEPNDARPQGAMHPTNPRIVKLIPRICAPLAERAGFQIIYADDLKDFDPGEFVQNRAARTIEGLDRDGVRPVLSADELTKLTRGE